MFAPETFAQVPAFKARKLAQWQRLSGVMPGLQLVQSGEMGTQFMLTISTDDIYESLIFGQLPHVMMETTGAGRNIKRRPMPEARKPLDRRAIDLTDGELDQIIAAWREKQSALDLPFVLSVWDRAGQRIVKR